MTVRRAKSTDLEKINDLLCQVLEVHHHGRPDIFKGNTKKYTDEELLAIIADDTRPIFVAVDESDTVVGYAFCVFLRHENSNILTDIKTLYIDDLCVDEKQRGKHIGTALYEHVVKEAKRLGCYHITLNVWCLNESALRFYEKCGLSPLKIVMEKII